MAASLSLHYACTERTYLDTDTGALRRAYRFEVSNADTGKLLCVVDDICSSKKDARALEKLFRRNQVAPVHVMDVLKDWLEERWGR